MAGPLRKPRADIYTALLVIALLAILLSILFMYLETADYGTDKYKGAPPVARLEPPAAATDHAMTQLVRPNVVVPTRGFHLAAIT